MYICNNISYFILYCFLDKFHPVCTDHMMLYIYFLLCYQSFARLYAFFFTVSLLVWGSSWYEVSRPGSFPGHIYCRLHVNGLQTQSTWTQTSPMSSNLHDKKNAWNAWSVTFVVRFLKRVENGMSLSLDMSERWQILYVFYFHSPVNQSRESHQYTIELAWKNISIVHYTVSN